VFQDLSLGSGIQSIDIDHTKEWPIWLEGFITRRANCNRPLSQ